MSSFEKLWAANSRLCEWIVI